MTINFNEATGGPVPKREVEIAWTRGAALKTGHRIKSVCLLGERVAAGTQTVNTVGGPFATFADLEKAAGAGSPVAIMGRRFYDFRSSETGRAKAAVYIAVMAEKSTGTAAVQTVTFTTTATGAGVWIFEFGGYEVQVNVSAGMTAIQQAAALVSAFNELGWDRKPALVGTIPANPNDHKATFTATVKGAHLNSIGLRLVQDANCGTTVALSGSYMGDAATGGTAGAGVQTGDLTTIIAAIKGLTAAGTIVVPWEDDATVEELVTMANDRANATMAIPTLIVMAHNAHASSTLTLGYAAQAAIAVGLDSNDAQRLVVTGCYGSPSWNGDYAARWAAARASEPHMARSLNDLADDTLKVPPNVANRYQEAHLKYLLEAGFTPYYVPDGESNLAICRAVTARTNLGVMDVAKVDVADLARDRIKARLGLIRRASIVSDTATLPPVAHVTQPKKVALVIIAELVAMQAEGLVTDVETLWEAFVSELSGTELRQATPLEVVAQWHNYMLRLDVAAA